MNNQPDQPQPQRPAMDVIARRPIPPPTSRGTYADVTPALAATEPTPTTTQPVADPPPTTDNNPPEVSTETQPEAPASKSPEQPVARKAEHKPWLAIILAVLAGLGLIAIAVMVYLKTQQETGQAPATNSVEQQPIEDSAKAIDDTLEALEPDPVDDPLGDSTLSDENLGL